MSDTYSSVARYVMLSATTVMLSAAKHLRSPTTQAPMRCVAALSMTRTLIKTTVWASVVVCTTASANDWQPDFDAARMQWFEGDMDGCARTVAALRESGDEPAVRALEARLHLRRGAITAARDAVEADSDDVTLLAARADVYDARGETAKANRVRLNAIEAVESVSALRFDEQLEIARMLRLLHRYKEANAVLQHLQDLNPHDPFMQLEKVRLYRATHGYALAAQTAKKFAETHAKCPEVYSEWGEILFALKVDSGAVQQLCATALEQDATLLAPRNLLVHYALLGNDWTRAEELIAANVAVNAADRRTLGQREASRVLRGEMESTTDRAALLELADVYAARGENVRALEALAPLLARESDDPAPMRRAALAAFGAGRFDEARGYAERASAANGYDVHMFNLRALLNSVADGRTLAKGNIEIVNTEKDARTSEYAAIVGSRLLDDARNEFGVDSTASLRLVVCGDRNDLAVATAGLPFGCACDPSDPAASGVVSFDNAALLWSPSATGGRHPEYRFDQGLYRAVLNAVVREATNDRAPQWLREGIAGAWMMARGVEWAPTNLAVTVDWIAAGRADSIAELESAVLSDLRPFALTYATLAVAQWRETYGDDAIAKLLDAIDEGVDWRDAIADAFNTTLDDLDAATQDAIVREYANRAPPEFVQIDANASIDDVERAAEAAAKALAAAPHDRSQLGVYRALRKRLEVSKSDAYYRLLEAMTPIERNDAQLRLTLAEWFAARGEVEAALKHASSAAGIRPAWIEAQRLVAELAERAGDDAAAEIALAVLRAGRGNGK